LINSSAALSRVNRRESDIPIGISFSQVYAPRIFSARRHSRLPADGKRIRSLSRNLSSPSRRVKQRRINVKAASCSSEKIDRNDHERHAMERQAEIIDTPRIDHGIVMAAVIELDS